MPYTTAAASILDQLRAKQALHAAARPGMAMRTSEGGTVTGMQLTVSWEKSALWFGCLPPGGLSLCSAIVRLGQQTA
jgi:hypothetical protein